MIKPQTLKGFRDFLPAEARKRQYIIRTLQQVFESYGFEPLETPALEYEEVLIGKYGDEGDKLMYRFEDHGKRRVALRYDQTVPLARVVAKYTDNFTQGLPMPFKRYQIQPVWRAENTQRGRFREFLQCDADIVSSSSTLADAEIMILAARCLDSLGLSNFTILYNDRGIFNGLPKQTISAIDKIKKIGKEGVIKELITHNVLSSEQHAREMLDKIESMQEPEKLKEIVQNVAHLTIDKSRYAFEPTLARGMDYYTGLIFEIEANGYEAGSIGGGGRYDNLIGLFTKQPVPAVGFSFGFDRLFEAMELLDLFPKDLSSIQVLVTIFSPALKDMSIKIANLLRENGIKTELYLDEHAKLEKQLRYANQKNVPYAIIIGPNEKEANRAIVKNLKTASQKTVPVKTVPNEIV